MSGREVDAESRHGARASIRVEGTRKEDMVAEIPYMTTIKNIPAIFEKMRSAGTPPKFNRTFLSDTLGFKGSGDRGVVKILKQLNLVGSDGTPQVAYNEFRQAGKSGAVLAAGLREGWPAVFLADENAHELSSSQLTEIMKNVSGKGESVAIKMASTFKALCEEADWDKPISDGHEVSEDQTDTDAPPTGPAATKRQVDSTGDGRTLTLHSDVHVHLPLTSDVAVYTAIFRAIREELVD